MDGKRALLYDEMGEIKKGPWKAEEDEVLMKHVKKYGPRDWSSIRSKGLLQRTGKSCRLRWVNKLRPNLKNGVKFSVEEERVVLELQAQFGNKWARIATYLPGRTDNDVKNFWSSRQKRLTRILQAQPLPPPPMVTPPSTVAEENTREISVLYEVHTVEAPKLSSSTEESCSSSSYLDNSQPIKMVPLPELVLSPNSLTFEQNLLQLEFTPVERKLCNESQPQLSPFPHIPQLHEELPLALENQELVTRLGDPNFLDTVGSEGLQFPYVLPSFGAEMSGQNGGRRENDNPTTPDSFIDDFPMDMFDSIEPLPSPSEWWCV